MTRATRDARSRTDLDTLRTKDKAQLFRVLPARKLAVPLEVRIESGTLCWSVPEPLGVEAVRSISDREEAACRALGRPRFRSPLPAMFEGFLRLSDASEEAIGKFAQRWGPLGICEHGLPHTHSPLNLWDKQAIEVVLAPPEVLGDRSAGVVTSSQLPCYFLVPLLEGVPGAQHALAQSRDEAGRVAAIHFRRSFCGPVATSAGIGRSGREPLEAWRRFSREARLILTAAARLHESGHWAEMRSDELHIVEYGVELSKASETLTGFDWRWVQSGLDRWIGYGNVRPSIVLEKGVPTICLGSAGSLLEEDMYIRASRDGYFFHFQCGLFGAIASQLLLASQNRGGMALCAECQSFFDPVKRPRSGERSFCPGCRDYRNKHAARDYRKRKKLALQRDRGPGSKSVRKGAPSSARPGSAVAKRLNRSEKLGK